MSFVLHVMLCNKDTKMELCHNQESSQQYHGSMGDQFTVRDTTIIFTICTAKQAEEQTNLDATAIT